MAEIDFLFEFYILPLMMFWYSSSKEYSFWNSLIYNPFMLINLGLNDNFFGSPILIMELYLSLSPPLVCRFKNSELIFCEVQKKSPALISPLVSILKILA